jgi:hypothetical protein
LTPAGAALTQKLLVSAIMHTRHYRSGLQLVVLLLGVAIIGCGDSDDDSPTSPTPGAGGSATTAVVVIENFTATSTSGPAGTFNYRASLRLRETGGASATVTGLTLTMTQASGVTVARDVTPAEAFPTATLAANGTLDSNTLTVTGAPVQATQLAARITYTAANGASSSVQTTTNVTPGS